MTPRNAHVCSHLPLSRSLSLFITPFLRSRSHSVFLWNRPSVMSTEISRHSAGASAGLTFLLPVIYIREGAHGGFSMPAKDGAATALLASTQGPDAVRDNGGTDHQAQRCLHSEKRTRLTAAGLHSPQNVIINGTRVIWSAFQYGTKYGEGRITCFHDIKCLSIRAARY